jgi:hypothetical protein
VTTAQHPCGVRPCRGHLLLAQRAAQSGDLSAFAGIEEHSRSEADLDETGLFTGVDTRALSAVPWRINLMIGQLMPTHPSCWPTPLRL